MEVEINKNGNYNNEYKKYMKLKMKIFDYFYSTLTKKDKTSKFTLFFLHILEIMQIISYAFFQPHLNTWKISQKSIEIISIITSGFRLAPIINYTSYDIYIIVFLILILLIFCFLLTLIMQILFRKENSKIYKGLMSITHLSLAPLTIIFYIPINELLIIIFKCYNDKIEVGRHEMKCWKGIHLLYTILSALAIIFSLLCLIFLNFFYYYPFQAETTTIKLNSTIEIIFLLIKFLYNIKLCFINDEYISISILLIFSILISLKELKNPTYNCSLLEIIINVRNNVILWTFFMLFIAILCKETEINGLIYLVFIGYPIIIFTSIMFTKEFENEFTFKNSNTFHNIKSCLSKTRMLIKLIDSFLDKNSYNKKYIEYGNKNDILLKGIIKLHTEICMDEECPLKKFIKNYGNFNVQKQCLLNYMTIYFNRAMKNFPDNKILRLYYIQFNFSKKYNLNSVRANLEYIKKMNNNIKDEFIIYYLENEIIKMKNKFLNLNEGNESEEENIIIGNNYKRLKELIINSTKLYAEFWGIFSNNITNNLNISKLYKIGEQLNIYLNEINYLWENNLKHKKIDIENEYISQLYSRFLREILWDKKKAEEVQKKINEEYHIQGDKRILKENQKSDIQNIIENQDYLILVNSNEKGKCNIFQFSNSLSYLIGYQKNEIINKPIEMLMPSIFIDGHAKKVEEFIKTTHLNNISDKESFSGIEKKKSFILIKNKMGYLVPFNAKFTVFDDNDFSNSYVIKAYLEPRDAKSIYAYYILTKDDFSIDNISSSAINLGLTMDLLKKYVIKLNILIRNNKENDINLFEKYKNFEEEPKKITWVYPHIIYPKNDLIKNKEKNIDNLIKISNKKKLNLQIFEMKYKENEIIGFVFKFTEMQNTKAKNEIVLLQDLFPSNKNEILFDLLTLKYKRTVIVQKKSGYRNLRDKEEEYELKSGIISKRKKTGDFGNEAIEESSNDEEKAEIILTKDKILELQGKDSNGINNFINLLPFYGKDISLIKHRPNKEEYIAGKTREPLIKIDLNYFINRIDIRLKERPSLYKKVRIMPIEKKRNTTISGGIKSKLISSIVKHNEINKKENDGVNIYLGDSSITLANIFNEKSMIKIKLLNFIIYVLILAILIIEFSLTYTYINNNKKKFLYLEYSYKLLTNFVYVKFFITEAIISNTVPNYIFPKKYEKNKYLTFIKSELENFHKEFTQLEILFNDNAKFSKNYFDYISYTNITIKTITNGLYLDEEVPLNAAMNRYATAVFYISTISDLESINMTDKYSYELIMNILNSYYLSSVNASSLIFEDIKNSAKNQFSVIIILFSIIFIFITVFIFYKFVINFIHDRQKPINLFLTIKKKVFEDLKNTAENFSNKLLNKFFGNEENEEESQQDQITNIKPNDINIAKFNSIHEYSSSINKGGSIMFYLWQLIIFFMIYEIYIIIKYLNVKNYFFHIIKFNDVYNKTQVCQLYFVIRLNILKQYFFNDSIPYFQLEYNLINATFYNSFHTLTQEFAYNLLITSKTNSFLKTIYKDLFKTYFYKDLSDFIKNNNSFSNHSILIKNGFKSIKMESFELMNILFIQYFLNSTRTNNEIKISHLINNEKWFELHELLINFIRPWYINIIEIMNSCFNSLADNLQTIYISVFILIVVLVTLTYCIIWKIYEEKFHNLLKKSFDLINLIPKEIKYIIVSKLNE